MFKLARKKDKFNECGGKSPTLAMRAISPSQANQGGMTFPINKLECKLRLRRNDQLMYK